MRVEQSITLAGLRFRLVLESEEVHGHVYLTKHVEEMKAKLERLDFGDVPVPEGDAVWAPGTPENPFRGQCPTCGRLIAFGHDPECDYTPPPIRFRKEVR